MTPSSIYRKTMVFNWYKLGLGVLTLFVCAVLFGAAWLLLKQADFQIYEIFGMCCGAFLIAVALYYFIMVREGYSIKLGHLALIEHALKSDSVPDNPIAYSKDIVAQRFGSSGKYYLFSRDLTIAITQISRVFSRGFSLQSDLPDLKPSKRFTRFFSLPALSYADECCMAYALRNKDYEVNAACIDALTYLAQNWNSFMNHALRMSLIIYGFVAIVALLFFVPGYAVCDALMITWLPWVGFSILIALVFKIAFLDSYILTKMVCSFLDSTTNHPIDSKNYIKLDHWSKTYAKIRKNAEKIAEKIEDDAEKSERKAKKEQKSLPPATENDKLEIAEQTDIEPVATNAETNKES